MGIERWMDIPSVEEMIKYLLGGRGNRSAARVPESVGLSIRPSSSEHSGRPENDNKKTIRGRGPDCALRS
jgi:hypothetical protein